jgi:sigma-E factor negative regulatory protein RseC
MLYQTGTVIENRGTCVRVEFDPVMACGGCSGGQGCGLGPLLAMFRSKERNFLYLEIESGDRVRVGDRVQVALPADQLVKFASLAYLMPLLGLIIGAWLATELVPYGGDMSAVAGAMLGALAGWGGLMVSGTHARVTLLH